MQLMADYSVGFHQGSISSSNYDHNLVSFQSEASHGSSVIANGFMSISDGNRNSGGMSLSGNPSAVNNMPAFSSPSASSSSNGLTGLMPKYKHVTVSPAYWFPYELAILKEGLIRYIIDLYESSHPCPDILVLIVEFHLLSWLLVLS